MSPRTRRIMQTSGALRFRQSVELRIDGEPAMPAVLIRSTEATFEVGDVVPVMRDGQERRFVVSGTDRSEEIGLDGTFVRIWIVRVASI